MSLEYIICFNHRSGSSWLASLLDAAGLGPCREFHYYERIEDKFENFLDCVGLKTSIAAIKCLEQQADLSGCKYLWLNRRDEIRQAISWYRADSTDRWSSFDLNEKPEPPFDYIKINELIYRLRCVDEKWENWLTGKSFLPVWYEDLLANSNKVVSEISTYLKKPIIHSAHSEFLIQRDALTEDFCQKFRQRSLHL